MTPIIALCATTSPPPPSPPTDQQRKTAAKRLLRQIHDRETHHPHIVHLFPSPLHIPLSWQRMERRLLTTTATATPTTTTQFNAFLSSRQYLIPHTVDTASFKCILAGTRTGRRFRDKKINTFISSLFPAIAGAISSSSLFSSAGVQLPQTKLSRFDLHHAHLFMWERGVGMLFHSKEYITDGDDVVVGDMGYCQRNTPLKYNKEAMAWRNTIWYACFSSFFICTQPTHTHTHTHNCLQGARGSGGQH